MNDGGEKTGTKAGKGSETGTRAIRRVRARQRPNALRLFSKAAVMISPAVQQANWCCRVALFSFGPECAIHQRARTATYKAIALGLPEGRRLWLCLLPLFSGLAGLGSLRLLGLKKRAESVSVCGCERHVLHISVHVRY